MKVPVKPNASQKKAIKAKYKTEGDKATAQKQARVKFFTNDVDADKAVKHVTTSKGYDPNPLKPRGGSDNESDESRRMSNVKKKTVYPDGAIRPKF